MFKHRIKAFILATCAFTVMAPAALAADDTNVTVNGGTLGFTAAPLAANFTAITLNGAAQTTTAGLDAFEVNDSRGSGLGWNVTVQGTQFAEHNGTAYVTSGKTLAANSLKLSAPTVAADGTTSAAPTVSAGPYTVDGSSAVKIASAATDTGMGKYDFSATTLTLSVPASAYAKTYRSDVTITVASTP